MFNSEKKERMKKDTIQYMPSAVDMMAGYERMATACMDMPSTSIT
jgi:hypothetical protein